MVTLSLEIWKVYININAYAYSYSLLTRKWVKMHFEDDPSVSLTKNAKINKPIKSIYVHYIDTSKKIDLY